MKTFLDKIRTLGLTDDSNVRIDSYEQKSELRVISARVKGEEKLLADGPRSEIFCGYRSGGEGGIKICETNHENRLVLNREFPYTAPQAIGRKYASIGCGDRLGNAGRGQLSAIMQTSMKPVMAQQSRRELILTKRSYKEVLDAAAWSVFQSGYKGGYGADGDHLKSLEEVEDALEDGVSMITLDASLVLGKIPRNEKERKISYEKFPESYRKRVEKEYLSDLGFLDKEIFFDPRILADIVILYTGVIELAEQVYLCMQKTGRQMDLELSLDETIHTTSVSAHYFVANELRRRQVEIGSLAPRFVGEFQKGIDYIGDVAAFRINLRAHCKIAELFGYKISIHSGSDKYKIFSAVAEETKGRFHLKTSGTSWLEAVRVIAQTEPSLYRDMHKAALEHFEQASLFYKVKGTPEKVPPLEHIEDDALPDYMEQEDARQLLHITYGAILNEKGLKGQIMEALERHRIFYEQALEKHFEKHLKSLGFF